MGQGIDYDFEEWFKSATNTYWKLSDSDKVRQLYNTLSFFIDFPPIIVVETSRIGNPLYIIKGLYDSFPKLEEVEKVNPFSQGSRSVAIRDRIATGMVFWMGLRAEEFCVLEGGQINLVRKTVNAPTLKQRKGKKGKKEKSFVIRPIPLDHVPIYELELWDTWLRKIGKDQKVFGFSKRTLERSTERVLGMHPHALRHGLGQFVYTLTKDISLTRQVLRHAPNSGATFIYTKLCIDGIRKVIGLNEKV